MDSFFPYRLAVAAEAFSQTLVDVYCRTYGLSREEWRLLFLLANAGSLTSLELAQKTSLDKVQVSRAAQKLEDKSLIRRTTSDTDRRLRVYHCTSEGQKTFETVFPKVQARAEEVFGLMTDSDRAALDQGLRALTQAMSERETSEQVQP
nr:MULTISPECIES: MarR family transcriptional regulator [unclassified Ruegeria]